MTAQTQTPEQIAEEIIPVMHGRSQIVARVAEAIRKERPLTAPSEDAVERKPFRMQVDKDWLRRKIEQDGDDGEVSAGIAHPEAPAEARAQYWKEKYENAVQAIRVAEVNGYMAGEAAAKAALAAGVAGQWRPISDDELREWGRRHNLGSICDHASLTDLRACYDDAVSLHMLPSPPAVKG